MFRIIIFITSFLQSSVSIIVVVDNTEQSFKVVLPSPESDARDPPILCLRRQLVPVSSLLSAVSGGRAPGHGLCGNYQDHRGKAGNKEERA